MSKTASGRVAKQYCEKYPHHSNLGLARMLRKDEPLLFNSVENARQAVRRLRGAQGNKDRKYKEVDRLTLPESDSEDWTPYIIPKSIRKLLILCDIHLPYQDNHAIEIALQNAKESKIDGILINGDLFDFYKGSRFEQDPRKRSMAAEIEMGIQFFNYLKQEFNVPVYFKYGNHDERWDKYIMLKAPELFGLDGIMLEDRLLSTGVHIIKDKRIVKHGHLDILHGHEFFGAPSQAVNPARGLFMKTLESCTIGHLHKSSSHTETSLGGRMITTHSIGCLCFLNPDYARINKWNHGFAINELTHGNDYILHNKRIFNGNVY